MFVSVLSLSQRVTFILLVSASILLLAQTVGAQETITVSGTIKTEQRAPGPVLVTIKNTSAGIAWTFLTDAQGVFRLEGVPEGEYSITAHHKGGLYPLADVGMLTADKHISHTLQEDGFMETIRPNAELLSELPQDYPELDIFEYQCVQCHGLEYMLSAPRGPEAWRETAHRMAKRVPTPPPGEIEAVSEYLAQHFTEDDELPPLYGKRDYMFEPDSVMVQIDLPDASAKPHEIEMGPDGRLWVADFSVTNEPGEKNIFLIDPATLEQEIYALPVSKRGGVRSITFDDHGAAWMVMLFDNTVLRLRHLSAKPEEFMLPAETWPHSATIDRAGQIWVTGLKSDRLVRLDPGSGEVTEIAIPSEHTMLYGIVAGPETIWYSGLFLHRLGAYDLETGDIHEFTPPASYSSPRYLKVKNGMVWAAFFGAGKIGRFDPIREEFEQFALGHPKSGPYDLEIDQHGVVWYTDFNRDAIGSLDPATGRVTEYSIPLDGHVNPTEMTLDSQGRVWFCENAAGRTAFLDPDGLRRPGVYVHSE